MNRLRWIICSFAAAAIVRIVLLLAWPSGKAAKVANATPANTYDQALERIAQLQKLDTKEVNSLCRLKLMTHGHKVERAIVLLHGFTNCPYQFVALGTLLHEQGYNVLIPRIPHHGLANRLSDDLAHLTAEELAAVADEGVNIAQGLGEKVTLVGLSGGGIATAWAAQNRSDIERAVIIAPVFGLKLVPRLLLKPVMHLSLHLPNRFIWWDSEHKDDAPRPPQAYPRFASRALAEVLKLGVRTLRQARFATPATRSIVMVTNASDPAVDNRVAVELVQLWRNHGATHIQTYEFPEDLHLIHDIIDPGQVQQQTALVYPILIDLIVGNDIKRKA